jgi:hypothetical protein
MDILIMKQLFTPLVRPHLEYGNVIWHLTLRNDKDLIEVVQRRATKMVSGLAKFSYEERLHSMGLLSMDYKRLRRDAIETFRHLNGKYPVDVASLLLRHESMGMMARGHCLVPLERECHSNIKQNFFSLCVVNMWNSLPEEVVTVESVNSFKARFDRWYADSKYKV